MKSFKIARLIIITIVLLSSCIIDVHSNFAVIKNDTRSRLFIAELENDNMSDSILYKERFSKTWIEPNRSGPLFIPNAKLKAFPDSAKIYLYIFNCDSMYKMRALKKVNDLVKRSFIQKIEIQLNTVKEPLDTIYVK
jgi:hypothetical protein